MSQAGIYHNGKGNQKGKVFLKKIGMLRYATDLEIGGTTDRTKGGHSRKCRALKKLTPVG